MSPTFLFFSFILLVKPLLPKSQKPNLATLMGREARLRPSHRSQQMNIPTRGLSRNGANTNSSILEHLENANLAHLKSMLLVRF
jgi:hypothetical protein